MGSEKALVRERKSGIELLRIIAMWMVISCHFVQLNPVVLADLPLGWEKVLLELEFGLGPTGVVIFFFITAWFLSDPAWEPSLRRSLRSFFRFWIETAFWTHLLCVVSFAAGGSLQLLVRSVLPVAIGPYWYVVAYAVHVVALVWKNAFRAKLSPYRGGWSCN